jgi:hypothetical protein
MIRRYCDLCGREITGRDSVDRNPLGRLKATIENSETPSPTRLSVEVIETKNGVHNAGDFCRYCVLDALSKLDDRTPEEKAKPPVIETIKL